MKFELIDAQKAHFPVKFMCRQPGVSRSGYYAWQERPESARHASDRVLAEVVTRVHQDSRVPGEPEGGALSTASASRAEPQGVERPPISGKRS